MKSQTVKMIVIEEEEATRPTLADQVTPTKTATVKQTTDVTTLGLLIVSLDENEGATIEGEIN